MKDWGIHKLYADQITRMYFLPDITINVTEYKNGKTKVTKLKDTVYMIASSLLLMRGLIGLLHLTRMSFWTIIVNIHVVRCWSTLSR